MNSKEFNERWKNLLYAPLDIPVPLIDYNKIYKWIETSNQEDDMFLEYVPDHDDDPGVIHGTYRCMFAKDENGWVCEFDKLFPEYIEFFKTLPLNYFNTMYLVQQTPERVGPMTSWVIHVDEINQFGLRVFLNKSEHGPTFYKIRKDCPDTPYYQDTDFYMKEGNRAILENGSYVPNTDVLHSSPYYTKSPHSQGAVSVLNNISAAHTGEYTLTGESRFFFVFHSGQDMGMSMLDFDKLDKLVEQSLVKYPEYTLYYDI